MNNIPPMPTDRPVFRTPEGALILDATYDPSRRTYSFTNSQDEYVTMPQDTFETLMTRVKPEPEQPAPAEDWNALLIEEAQQTATRLNDLNKFMGSDRFPILPREDKDLFYEQQRAMSTYVQILGKRIERAGAQFTHNR